MKMEKIKGNRIQKKWMHFCYKLENPYLYEKYDTNSIIIYITILIIKQNKI